MKNMKNKKVIVAIDGVSASGKGSIADLIAKNFNFVHLETGLFYRAIGYYALIKESQSIESLAEIAKNINIEDLKNLPLHNEKVAQKASEIAQIRMIRENLLDKQRNFANNPPKDKNGVVLDGRDIGTIVCPNADIKFFLNANLEIRVKRRYEQLKPKISNITLKDVRNALIKRDNTDNKLNEKALNSNGYIVIDNSNLSLLETFDLFKSCIIKKLNIK